MLKLGIDDAGRGPLIGPMILAGVLVDLDQEKILKENNIRDSKMVSHPERVRLAGLIRKNSLAHKVVKTFPEEIDGSLDSGVNLNTLEAMEAAKVVNSINVGEFREKKIEVVVDCPSVNTLAWKSVFVNYLGFTENLVVKCEHKADANHVSVGAGSILAKVAREEEVAKIKKEFGEIGSGYPSDPTTKLFLKKRGKELSNSGIFRKSWSTWKKLFPQKSQKSLGDF